MIGPRATVLVVAVIASFAGGGGAAASMANDPSAGAGQTRVVRETSMTPLMDLPNGCSEDWSSEGSID